MPAFVDAVDIPTCKAALDRGEWKYSCGLSLADASVRSITSEHRATKSPTIFQRAHTAHHDGTGGRHDPTATFYFVSDNDGNVVSATCSCLYVRE